MDVLLKDKHIALSDDHKIPKFEQRKGNKYCKFHNVFGHWTNSCLCFRDMIHKAINEGRLKFEEKPMEIDTNPFWVQDKYVKPIQILMVEALIGISKVETPLFEDEVNRALEDFEKEAEGWKGSKAFEASEICKNF